MTPKYKSRPCNNISRLPREIRKRIAYLLDDGKTYDDIRKDDDVSRATQENAGKKLHSTSFIAFKASEEHKKFMEVRHNKEYTKERLLEIFDVLDEADKVRLVTLAAANFPDKIKEETKEN